ncbi:MAG: alpha/beta hydrolase [Erysipelotrichia bacterium]|nr:alpha/beta hydrolase [Erysipelotrichia bacterium]
MIEKRIFIKCVDHDIPMVIMYPDGAGPFPCVLLLHGYMAYKEGDGYLLAKTAAKLAENGIATARIDFCSMGENRYSRIHYGISIMIKETRTSFEWLQNDSKIISDRIGILGHSLGGRIAFLSAELPSKCLITFNGAVNTDRPVDFLRAGLSMEEIADHGYTVIHTSDGRYELVFEQFIKDLSICSDEIYHYQNPILVCVGEQDPTLDPSISYQFVKNCNMPNVEMIKIDNANHTFNAKTGDYTKVYELLGHVVTWLKKNL